jgi:predicted ATPase
MTVPSEAGHQVATDAVTLFFARAAMAGMTLEPGPGELTLAGSICRKAGGLPLALELVANRLRVASLTELEEGLATSVWPARSMGSGRHDSLDACLTWSHALLPADAGVVFRRLSVFPGGFDLAAAREVAGTRPVGSGQVGALVEQLVTASLLEADTSGVRTRFRFHEPVRQYAAATSRRCRGRGPWRSRRCVPGPEAMSRYYSPREQRQSAQATGPTEAALAGSVLRGSRMRNGRRRAILVRPRWSVTGCLLRATLAPEAPVEPLAGTCRLRSGWRSWSLSWRFYPAVRGHRVHRAAARRR